MGIVAEWWVGSEQSGIVVGGGWRDEPMLVYENEARVEIDGE